MILSDTTLREAFRSGRIALGPGEILYEQVQPASVDVMLGRSFRAFKNAGLSQQPTKTPPLDFIIGETPQQMRDRLAPRLNVADFDANMEMESFEADVLILAPFQFCLGTTTQSIRLPADLRGHLFGRSSLARLGLVVHTVAGNLDPGFEGEITLELLNVGSRTLEIPAGWRVAHVSFEELDKAAARPYGQKPNSKYQGQVGATGSRISHDTMHQERNL